MLKIFIYLVVLVGLFLTFAQQAESQQKKRQTKNVQSKSVQPKNLTAEQIAKKFLPSVVLIVCDNGKGNLSQGSGFFIRENVILTNYHVIKGMVRGKAKTALNKSQSEEWWISAILFVDAEKDLALISISSMIKYPPGYWSLFPSGQVKPNPIVKVLPPADEDFSATKQSPPDKRKQSKEKKSEIVDYSHLLTKPPPVLSLSKSDQITIGEKIYVLSNPEGLIGTISQGIVSSDIRKVKDSELLQIDAPISSGSSGGAVLNARGEVIGIATGSLSSGQNLNFAVPSFQIKSFINKYNSSLAFLLYSRSSSIPNAWLKQGLEQANVPPKIEQKSKLTYEEITKRITDIILNTSVTMGTQKSQGDISFSQCKVNYTRTFFDLSDNVGVHKTSYQSNIQYLKEVKKAQFLVGVVSLIFERGTTIKTRENYPQNGYAKSSMGDEIDIQLETKQPETKQLEIIFLFSELKKYCENKDNSLTEKPDLKETTDWLTTKIEGSEVTNKEEITKVVFLRFSQCQMNLIRVYQDKEIKSVDTYKINLNSLNYISTGRYRSKWMVALGFDQSFNVDEEIVNNGVPRHENEEIEGLAIDFDRYEDAKQVMSAFTIVMELCFQGNKEPS